MNMAIGLDTANTFAYFNRAIMYYEQNDYNSAMSDLNRVLADEPGNALTLYNRSLINAQIGNLEEALQDMDRVIGINPGNVLAYFNRASVFIQMERWKDALEDYDKAIELYPDFAKAYMNRSYVESMLGMKAESKKDYDTARRKVSEYRARNAEAEGSFADTTKKYSSLLSLDAEFAKKDFDNEMLQHRDIDVKLRPLYRFVLADNRDDVNYALKFRYENALLDRMLANSPVPVVITSSDTLRLKSPERTADRIHSLGDNAEAEFLKALYDISSKQFNSAMIHYGNALENSAGGKYEELYKAFYYMNRAVLRADMIEFISSIENNVQTLTMDDQGTTRARVKDQVSMGYDYSDAVADMRTAAGIVGDIPYIHFNLGNLLCLSSSFVEAIDSYSRAISLYPYMGDAYFNRGLVLIYLKDKEKGCIDLSHAGELGVADAYGVIKKYCEEAEQ